MICEELAYLSENEGCVIFEIDLTAVDHSNRSGTAAEEALAGFLRSGINHLPTSETTWQISSSHPGLIPHVVVPT